MAILIGVIALAVIPNIQRSRESKDLTTLDNILSSTNIAIANNKVTGAGNFTYTGTKSSGTADADKINNAVCEELGAVSLGSSKASGGSIEVSWTAATASAAAKITVKVKKGSEDPAVCEYTSDDAGNKKTFLVTN